MKKVIVTGGCGFIGSNLIIILLKRKFRVLNIDRLSYASNKYNLKEIKSKNYSFKKVDISNKNKILKIIKNFKPDCIFNLAAETHVDRSIDNPSSFIQNNINGVFGLLEAIRDYKRKYKKKIRLVHVSTDEVYGDIKGSKRSLENDLYMPSSPYSASKASADHLIQSYVRTYNLDAVISNCSNNYGPRQFPEKLIPKMIYNILNNKPLPVYGKGKNSREWIFVEDHCDALITIFKKGKKGEKYNIGSNINLTNLSLVKKLFKITKILINKKMGPKVRIKFVKDRPGHDFRYALNSNKIRRSLKWKSKMNFDIGISKTIKWYLKNKNYFKTITKKKFNKRLGLNL